MRSLLTPKSLAFYGASIATVLSLFSIVTTYGEANLKAPRKIDGRYPIAGTLPGCLQGKTLVLTVHQSGRYLSGTLLPADASEKTLQIAEERPSLTGRWEENLTDANTPALLYGNNITTESVLSKSSLTLEGAIAGIPTCKSTAQIQGTVDQDTLNGTLKLSDHPSAITFSAKQEAPLVKTTEH